MKFISLSFQNLLKSKIEFANSTKLPGLLSLLLLASLGLFCITAYAAPACVGCTVSQQSVKLDPLICTTCGDGKIQGEEECDGTAERPGLTKPADIAEFSWINRKCGSKSCTYQFDKCGNGIIDPGEECDGAAERPGLSKPDGVTEEAWKRRSCGLAATASACKITYPESYCGDGIINFDWATSKMDECDGRAFPARPENIPPILWDDKKCSKECKIVISPFCGDGLPNEDEICDWKAEKGQPGYMHNCKMDCTPCIEADSCGRSCDSDNYGNPNCCEDIPRPADENTRIECKFLNTNPKDCYSVERYCSEYDWEWDEKNWRWKSRCAKWTDKACAFTGREFVNGVATGKDCAFWLERYPDGHECKNLKEACLKIGTETRTELRPVVHITCKAEDMVREDCNLEDPTCVLQDFYSCSVPSDEKERAAIALNFIETGKPCTDKTKGCIEASYNSCAVGDEFKTKWVETETSECSQKLVDAAKECSYRIVKGKRIETGCRVISDGRWTDKVCTTPVIERTEWKEPLTEGCFKVTKLIQLDLTNPTMGAYCKKETFKVRATQKCTSEIKDELLTFDVDISECKQVGDYYINGVDQKRTCDGTTTSLDRGTAITTTRVNNLYQKQCVQGNVELNYTISAENPRPTDKSNPWSLLNRTVNYAGVNWDGKWYVSNPEYIKDSLGQICWTCAMIRYIGCFDPETNITMADGSQKKIRELSAGEEVFNPVTKKAVKVNKILESPEELELVEIQTSKSHLKVTQGHPVYLKDRGNVRAIDVKEGDLLVDESGVATPVKQAKLVRSSSKQTVINITLEGSDNFDDHMLIANGLYSGDLFVQEKLKGSEK